MSKQSFWRRFLQPAGTVLLIWALMSVVYLELAWRLGPGALRNIIASSSAVFLLLSLGFGALYIHPVAFFRGDRAADFFLVRFFAISKAPHWNRHERESRRAVPSATAVSSHRGSIRIG